MNTRGREVALDVALRLATQLWKTAVFEDADTGECFQRYADIEIGNRREFFVYKDARVAAKWEQLGADESLVGTMVYLIGRERELTVVTDPAPPPDVASYLAALDRTLAQDLFGAIAWRQVA